MLDKPAGLPVDAPRRGGEFDRGAHRMSSSAASSGRRRRCTGSTPTPAAACCSRARPRRAPRSSRRSRARAVEKYYIAVVGAEIAEDEGVDRRAARQGLERRSGVADGRRSAWAQRRSTRWRRLAVRDGSDSGRVSAADRAHAPDPRARARGVRARHCRRPRLWRSRRPDAAPRVASRRPARAASRRSTSPRRCPIISASGAMRPEDVHIPEEALSESFPRRDRPRRAERQQGRDRRPAARRPVQARPSSRRLRAAEAHRRKPGHERAASCSSPPAASARRTRTAPMPAAGWRK